MGNNRIVNFIKTIYTRAYLFWAVNIFCFIIIFFVLNEKTGGGIGGRIFAFLFCLIVGGFLGMYWSIKRNGDKIKWFRYGAGTFLMFFTLLMWSNNNYKSPYRKSAKIYSSSSYSCPHCDGSGNRINNLTGQYGDCSSCGGDGKVTEEQYNRLSK